MIFSFYTENEESYWLSNSFDNKVTNYSDVACLTLKDGNNQTNVVINGPHGTDIINLDYCLEEGICNSIAIANGKGGTKYYIIQNNFILPLII